MITICMAWHHIGGFRKGTWPEALSVREVYIGYNLRMEVSVDFMNAVGSGVCGEELGHQRPRMEQGGTELRRRAGITSSSFFF